MSRPHYAQRTSLSFGNPFRMILPKGSYLSPKLLTLVNSFEQTMAESLRKLKPKDTSDVLSLSWMRRAMQSLCETHTNIKTLIADLQFPVPDWDEKWMDMYFDNSVKVLDICIALISELSRLDQSQLLLRYVLHILAFSGGTSPPSDQLKRAHASLREWMQQIRSRSPKLENCSTILQVLVDTPNLVKVKNSAKGKVLMRALYGVKVETIFVCSVFTAALSGSSKPLKDLHVSGDFLWAEAFNDLQADVHGELRCQLSQGKSVVLKEMEAVNACVEKLYGLSIAVSHKDDDDDDDDDDGAEQTSNDINDEEVLALEKTMGEGEKEGWKELASELAESAESLARELDLLSKKLEDFFQLVLSGREALLCNLRVSDVKLKGGDAHVSK